MQAGDETQDPTKPAGHGEPEGGQRLVLTLLFHPDFSRVGEVAEIALERGGRGECLVGRETPLFRRPGEPAGRALLDPCISRRQLTLRCDSAQGIRAEPEPGARRALALLDSLGRPIAGGEPARSGALLAIGDRVLLGLQVRNDAPGRDGGDLGMVGEGAAITTLRQRVQDLAAGSETVLVMGETGAGKELVARALHQASRRRAAPFVAVNCAAIPENLLESELFGHVKGAFTGAVAHEGLLRSAREGTLLLDEIGELPLGMQAKLLRAIELRCVRPVGSTTEIPFSARLVAATHRDLDRAAAQGTFREDLLARLDGLRLQVPPLRERREDVPLLFVHFLRRALDEEAHAGPPSRLEALFRPASTEPPPMPLDAMLALVRHDWPRNVRELARTAAATAADNRRAGPFLWPALAATKPAPTRPREQVIREALDAHDHIQNRTAAALGVSPTTLDRWRRTLGIVRPRDLSRTQIEQALAEANGDLEAAARTLRISLRGLQLRWRELQEG